MADLTVTTPVDTFMQSADQAAMRSTGLGLGALATVTPGTGVATALAVNVGTAGAPVLLNGAGGTPSAIVLTNGTGLVPSTGTTASGTPGSTTFLRGDNTWAAPAGTGTVTVVSAGSLTSTALVTGGGSQTLQTPAATATMDASGNISTPGTLTVGSAATTAGAIALTQGTTQSTGTTNITLQAPTGVTSYIRTLPAAVGATGFLLETVAGSVQTESLVPGNGSGNVVLTTSATLVTPALGTPASGVVTNLTGTASININGTVGATTPAVADFTAANVAISTLTYSATVAVNFGGDGMKNLALTGSWTPATSTNFPAANRTCSITIFLSAASTQTLDFSGRGWTFVGAAAPTSLAAGKKAILTLTATTSADSGVFAAYSAQV